MRTTGLEPARSKANTSPSSWRVYQFRHVRSDKIKKIRFESGSFFKERDLAGARTQDPILKRDVLYQLSYQVFINSVANIPSLFYFTRIILINF